MDNKNHYANTAYNSQSFIKQKRQPSTGWLYKIMTKGSNFSFTRATECIDILMAKEHPPKRMKEWEQDPKKTFWDQESLEVSDFNIWGRIYLFFVMAGTSFSCLSVFMYLFWIYLGPLPGETLWESLYNLAVIFIPCYIISIHWFLYKYMQQFWLAPWMSKQRLFTLNRQTGMVTLYKRGKVYFEHPFIEFDCVLMSSPTHQGHLHYKLMLVHRYGKYKRGVPLSHSLGSTVGHGRYLTYWNMVQRYMDTSQPMPDISFLEPSREKDPVTAKHDKATGRPPRYWRDMSEEEYNMALDELSSNRSVGAEINIFE